MWVCDKYRKEGNKTRKTLVVKPNRARNIPLSHDVHSNTAEKASGLKFLDEKGEESFLD